MKTKVVNKPRF